MKPIDESPASATQPSRPKTVKKKSIKQLLNEYHASHTNRSNQIIHYLCVPLIFWSITAVFWQIKLPIIGNLSFLLLALLMLYYLFKSLKVMLVMALFSALCIAVNMAFDYLGWPLLITAVIVFVVSWVGQFIGHHIEGKRPSFFQDLQFLLIGPAWVAFKMFGIRL